MMPARAADVSGRVITANGLAGRERRARAPVGGQRTWLGSWGSRRIAPDGSFRFPRVLTGRYELHAR